MKRIIIFPMLLPPRLLPPEIKQNFKNNPKGLNLTHLFNLFFFHHFLFHFFYGNFDD